MSAEFVGFDDADSDRPGMVVLNADTPGDDLSDEAFWMVVTDQAWDDEWWYGEPDAQQFADKYRDDVEDAWAAWVREHIMPPDWRWWVERPDPTETYEGDLLTPADESEDGAFRAALIIFAASSTPTGGQP